MMQLDPTYDPLMLWVLRNDIGMASEVRQLNSADCRLVTDRQGMPEAYCVVKGKEKVYIPYKDVVTIYDAFPTEKFEGTV